MKKKLLSLILTVAAIGVVPISAYASSDGTNEIIINQKIGTGVSENGSTSEYRLVNYENQTAEMARAVCSTGILYFRIHFIKLQNIIECYKKILLIIYFTTKIWLPTSENQRRE